MRRNHKKLPLVVFFCFRASRRTDTASSIINISVSQVLEDALHIRESSVSDG